MHRIVIATILTTSLAAGCSSCAPADTGPPPTAPSWTERALAYLFTLGESVTCTISHGHVQCSAELPAAARVDAAPPPIAPPPPSSADAGPS